MTFQLLISDMTNPYQTALPTEPGFRKEWLADHQILCYRFHHTTRASVDGWIRDILAEIRGWDDPNGWCILVDLHDETNVISAYFMRRAREITRARPELPGKTAVLVKDRAAAQVMQLIFRGAQDGHRQRAVFACESDALAWLQSTGA